MISTRATPESNLQRCEEALQFAKIFFLKQDKEKESLVEMYHDQSTLIWNGQHYKSKQKITNFYCQQSATETTLECLDTQILPQMGDIIDMITIIAGGRIKQNNVESNFSRTFLLGPDSPGSAVYLIVSDTVRTYNRA